ERSAFFLVSLLIGCFALLPKAHAVSPPPDGGYAGNNTAEGENALFRLTTGARNTGIGFEALFSTTTGDLNTASGFQALHSNTEGRLNTANCYHALFNNTTGEANTATGSRALVVNTTGVDNAANGYAALGNNTTGDRNTATGTDALFSNTMGTGNTAMGFQALFHNRTGNQNAAVGEDALSGNTTGHDNIALGYGCGGNITTGSQNIDIGNRGLAGDDGTIRIGTSQTATFIAGIDGATVASGVGVIVDSNGHLGTVSSSERFKEAIEPMDKTSEAILALKPVAFRYKHELDPEGIPQFGLVAEQVEKVNPDLVARHADGKPYTVRYDAVNAMLLNEFLKEHHQVQDLRAIVAQQQKQIQALTAGLQKVSGQVEMSRLAPQMVSNSQ
ncbi:MAG: tail fiber domain-containing protein, partial [Candidatus Udaeobacter sp.]